MQFLTEKMDLISKHISEWVDGLDTEQLTTTLALIAVTVLLRRPLASLITTVLARVLAAIGINPNRDIRAEIQKTISTLLVTVVLLIALRISTAPTLVTGIIQDVLISIVVVVVYGAFYRRADLIISALLPNGASKFGTDTSWMVGLLRLAVVVLAFATVLEVWGLSISGAMTGVGVFGAGVAIAAQDFVSNFVAGLNNVSERRFRPGDWIKVGTDLEGTVASMDLRSTTVMGFDRVPRFVPNSDLANSVLLNYNRMDHRQISWTFGLRLDATDEQIEAVCADLRQYIKDSGDYVTDGKLLCLVTPSGLSDSAVEIMIYIFAKTASYQPYLEVCGKLTMALRAAVARAGTELAYPTQTIVFENGQAPAGQSLPAESANTA